MLHSDPLSQNDATFWTENQFLTTLSWHSFFLSRTAGALDFFHCELFLPYLFFLELVKELVANSKKIIVFTCRYIPYILMVLMFPKNRNFIPNISKISVDTSREWWWKLMFKKNQTQIPKFWPIDINRSALMTSYF